MQLVHCYDKILCMCEVRVAMVRGRLLIGGGGGAHIHIFVFTDCKND